jgi:phosphoribosyl-AMP cyclohydrolase
VGRRARVAADKQFRISRKPASPAGFFFAAGGFALAEAAPPHRGAMDFSKLDGLIPAVVQDAASNEVLMVGFMNDEAWTITRRTGYVTFFSRTRNTLWTKGETSGNRLKVLQILSDCDDDTVLVKVEREGDGNVCHTGQRSCFFNQVVP